MLQLQARATSAGILVRSIQNNHPDAALIKSARTEPSEEADMLEPARRRAASREKAVELTARLPTIASYAAGSDGEDERKKIRKSSHVSSPMGGGG